MKKTACKRNIGILAIFLAATLLCACGGGTVSPNSQNNDYARQYDEIYLPIKENVLTQVAEQPLLSLSLKVDTASYSNVARYLQTQALPPKDAVRVEEMVNYFTYDEAMAFDDTPFGIRMEIGPSPFNVNQYMAMIRVKSKDIPKDDLPPSNLTFLIDTSGSMESFDKLPLLQSAFSLLVETLRESDTVSIVTYAGSTAVVLDSVPGSDKARILAAISSLKSSGSTAGANGIQSAYTLAEKNFIQGANNRVILATDGDFNVGISDTNQLSAFIGEKRGNGIYLSVLGFGMGNIRDDIMETLAKDGNGNYAYIHTLEDAKKVLVDQMGTNLFTIADDVKAQVEFNPQLVTNYRLIGYENRKQTNQDFIDDAKDAGEIGIDTDVVILFEIGLSGEYQGLKYATPAPSSADEGTFGNELFEVRIRYKNPGQDDSHLLTRSATKEDMPIINSDDFHFACTVAAFGHLLRESPYAGSADIDTLIQTAIGHLGKDTKGYRTGFVDLLRMYKQIK